MMHAPLSRIGSTSALDKGEPLFLSASIDQQQSAAIDAAWLAEVKRRDAEFIAGRTEAKPVGEVISRLLSQEPGFWRDRDRA